MRAREGARLGRRILRDRRSEPLKTAKSPNVSRETSVRYEAVRGLSFAATAAYHRAHEGRRAQSLRVERVVASAVGAGGATVDAECIQRAACSDACHKDVLKLRMGGCGAAKSWRIALGGFLTLTLREGVCCCHGEYGARNPRSDPLLRMRQEGARDGAGRNVHGAPAG